MGHIRQSGDCRAQDVRNDNDMTTADIIKKGVIFRQKEFLLSLVVFAYLMFSLSILLLKFSERALLLLQFFFLLFENYITVAVYYGIKEYIFEGKFNLSEIFVKAGHFFFRVLSYKLFAGFFALLLVSFCISMIELVKSSSLAAAGFITGFTILWIAFPVYLLLLTFMAPLIIIAEDALLFVSVKTSLVFIRENLAEIAKLVLFAAPFWAFALFLTKVYNDRGLFLLAGTVFYFIAVLEIVTIKIFLLFYRERKKGISTSP